MALWDTWKAAINLWDLDQARAQSEPLLDALSKNQTQSREV